MHLSNTNALRIVSVSKKPNIFIAFAKDLCVYNLKRSLKLPLQFVIVSSCLWLFLVIYLIKTLSITTVTTIEPIPLQSQSTHRNFRQPKPLIAQSTERTVKIEPHFKESNKHFDPTVIKKHNIKSIKRRLNSKNIIAKKNYPKHYEDNLHPQWTFKISRKYMRKSLHHWTEPNYTVPKSQLWTQGENGNGFAAKDADEADEIKKSIAEHKYNLYASEHMPLHRSLPDYRYAECRKLTYPDRLPNVSVIIVVHNEAWTLVLRTIWSVIDRSPRELLHEIIVVDDASSWDFLKRPLNDYAEFLPATVRILRTMKREGLIRARLNGAKNATGNILIFLDAHSECTAGWLEPLTAHIANDRSAVAVPLIDAISSKDLSYFPSDQTRINGFPWYLTFNWMAVPERELLRTKQNPTAPLRTPTHIGCAFAIDREFFFEIGSYDEGMDIWGSENVELAFRVWMCGSSLEILPCSRVGHLYRVSTYSFDGDQGKIVTRNNNRLIEVWMDEFRNLIYAAYPKSKDVSPGDLTARKQLRDHLKCKSFRWYLEHIYPESVWLKEYIQMGEIKNVWKNKCLDTGAASLNGRLMLWQCHGYGGSQFFAFSKAGQIVVIFTYCVGINHLNEVILVRCSDTDNTQLWTYNKERQWMLHRDTDLCMQNSEITGHIILGTCNSTDVQFHWTFKSTMPTN